MKKNSAKRRKNEGKIFEGDVQNSALSQGIWILRLNDTSLSWMPEKQSKFTPQNKCDFLIYRYPYLFPIECKSTEYTSMSIQTDFEDSNKMIKSHQIKSLAEMSVIKGVYPGFMLNFRNSQEIERGVTYWLSIRDFNDFFVNTDKVSINRLDVINHNGIIVDQKLKRTHFAYDINKMLDDIIANSYELTEDEIQILLTKIGSKSGDSDQKIEEKED